MLSVLGLRMLLEVHRRGSIAAAAAALGYTASAGSQQLSVLEREARVLLLERGARSVRLTEAGGRLASHAEHVLDALAAAEQEMLRLAGLQQGTLRIAAFPSALASLLPPLLQALRDALPGITVTFEDQEPAAAFASLRRGDIDVALVYDFLDRPLHPLPDLEVIPLGDDPFQLCVQAGHPLARRTRVDLTELQDDIGWVIDGEPPIDSTATARHLHSLGVTPRVTARSNDSLAVLALVAAGVGVALLPRLQVGPGYGTTAVPLTCAPPPRRVLLAHRSASQTAPTHRTGLPVIAEQLTSALQQHPRPSEGRLTQ